MSQALRSAAGLLLALAALGPAAPRLAAHEPPEGLPGAEGMIKFGSGVSVRAGETIEGPVVALGGPAHVEGRVDGPVVALGGDVRLGPEAEVEGPAVAIGGETRLAPGARCEGPTVSVPLSRISLGLAPLLAALGTAAVAVKAAAATGSVLAALLLGLLFPQPLERTTAALRTAPGRAALVGLLFWPALAAGAIALAVTIVGLAAWPFLVLLAAAAWLWGTCALGLRVGEEILKGRGRSFLARLALGVVVLKGVGLIPIAGVVACAAIGILGAGAAVASGFGLKTAKGGSHEAL